MTAITLDGELLASEIKGDLRRRIEVLADRGITPGLGTLLVGEDGPSTNYVAMKHRDCTELGMHARYEHLPSGTTQASISAVIDAFNADPTVDAFIVQYPFPGGLDYEAAIERVDPAKDADGLHPVNLGKLVMGVDAPLACTPAGIQALLERYEVPIAGSHVVIVGRGLTIGRPLANLLSLKLRNANAAVTVVHTGIADIAALHPPGRHPRRRRRITAHDHRRHGQARGSGGRRGRQLRGHHGRLRRRRRRRRGRGLAVATPGRGRADDPGDAAGEHGQGCRARRRLTHRPRPGPDRRMLGRRMADKITINDDSTLNVSDNPIIPFIEGDGTGVDIWPAAKLVLDAAAAKYGKTIEWREVLAGEKAFNETGDWLPQETIDVFQEYLIGIKGPLTTPIGGGFRSLNVALRQILDLYVCLRPVRWFQGVPSPVKHPELVDMVIFRENTEDIYAGIEAEAGTAPRPHACARSSARSSVARSARTAGIGIKPISETGSQRLQRAALTVRGQARPQACPLGPQGQHHEVHRRCLHEVGLRARPRRVQRRRRRLGRLRRRPRRQDPRQGRHRRHRPPAGPHPSRRSSTSSPR